MRSGTDRISRPVNMPEAPSTPALCLRLSPLRSGSQGETESYSEVVQVRRLREAIRRLNPAIPFRTTLRDPDRSGLPKLLSVAEGKWYEL